MSITSISGKIAAASLFTIGLAVASWSVAYAEETEEPFSSLELVDPHVFRVCADPRNLPFSNEAGEGFENKLAEFFAKKLDKKVAYAWYPGAPGFVRKPRTASTRRASVAFSSCAAALSAAGARFLSR